MLCEDKCDAGGPNRLSEILEIRDFGLALASRQPAPELKRTIWCVFLFGFPCPVDFYIGWRSHTKQKVLLLQGRTIPTQIRPTQP